MKIAVSKLLAVIVALCLFEAGLSSSDLAFSKAGLIALALSFALMLAGLTIELLEWRRENSMIP